MFLHLSKCHLLKIEKQCVCHCTCRLCCLFKAVFPWQILHVVWLTLLSLSNRYHEQSGITDLRGFKFGPLFMRLCFELDLETPAVELIKDQVISSIYFTNIIVTYSFSMSNWCALHDLRNLKYTCVSVAKMSIMLI